MGVPVPHHQSQNFIGFTEAPELADIRHPANEHLLIVFARHHGLGSRCLGSSVLVLGTVAEGRKVGRSIAMTAVLLWAGPIRTITKGMGSELIQTIEIIKTVASLATVVAVILTWRQLRLVRKQATTTFEDRLTEQYRSIMEDIPTDIWLGSELKALGAEQRDCCRRRHLSVYRPFQ